jgi:hypothetical protein
MMSTTPPSTFPSPCKLTLPASDVEPRFPVGDVRKKAYGPFRVAFDAVPVPVNIMVTRELLVPSSMEVATISSVLPDGAETGAVKVVKPPLGVETGLKDPQPPDGLQLQFTPASKSSLETVAPMTTLSPVWIVDGGRGLIFTEIGDWGKDKDNTRLALLLPSVTELAVSVTWPPEGRTAGAE